MSFQARHNSKTPQQKLNKLRYCPQKVDTSRGLLQQSFSFHTHNNTVLPCTLLDGIVAAATHSHGPAKDAEHVHHHQRWYDDECKALRKQLNSMHFDDPGRKHIEDRYNQLKKKSKRRAQLQLQQKLCEYACSSAQAFWRSYRRRDHVPSAITPQQWHSAFKDLFAPEVGLG